MATNFSRLPPLPPLREFIHMYRLQAKKILSQNYLMDMNLTRKIVRAAGVQPGNWVCEVGPGPGGITRAILEADCERLDVVEIDHRFIPPLELLAETSDNRLRIHRADVLKTNIGDLWGVAGSRKSSDWTGGLPALHIIGNLPFNIASPLIIRLLKDISYRQGAWRFGRVPLTLTFQMEVAQRICSPIDCESRSRISIMAQYLTEPKLMFRIPGSCFVPQPDIDVGIVRFVPRIQPLISAPFEVVEKLCRQVFHYRQKFIIKGLKTLYPKEVADDMANQLLKDCRVNPKASSIQLGIEEYADLAAGYERQCRSMPGLILYDSVRPKYTIEMLSGEPGAIPPENPFRLEKVPSEGVRLSDADRFLS
nr:Ribosomal RNA adenine methylase transferase domain containing protein [Haemonchus contortus]